ncbi:hypothetical protein CDL15_Pgr024563 [Punica granatum]|uniref:ubiquitinyl hydrolase 1 n=1 Tax=Punica granatum TaxID=22663 RepID=A0A218XXC8_PUNGR|nr:hypothetical protein CDL15_Pgr024563 [Punica granatum]
MQNNEEHVVDGEAESASSAPQPEFSDWAYYADEDTMKQPNEIPASESEKIPFVGDKANKLDYLYMQEPLSALAAEYQSGSPILLEKIKEHILETQDKAEVDRITANVEECRRTLQGLGYIDFTFEDFFALFLEQLESVLQGHETSISHDDLLQRSRDPSVSDYVVMFFRFVTTGEIRKRSEFFEPFIMGLASSTVEQFCKSSVEPMGEESDHVHITALSDALGVPIRVVYLDRSSCDNGGVNVNHHDFVPSSGDSSGSSSSSSSKTTEPFIVLLYRPGHYDILYPK